jgi:hypothetical protein
MVRPQAVVRIRVVRIPAEVPEEDRDAWVAAHPEAISKVVEVPAR